MTPAPFFCCLALLVLLTPAAAAPRPDRPGVGDSLQELKPLRHYRACRDGEVTSLVGMPRAKALQIVKQRRYLSFRSLAPTQTVTYEVKPDRLTLVIGPDEVIWRAFCR